MPDESTLKKILGRIDGRGYKAYKDLQGQYNLNGFIFFLDHVQGDPYAPPSRCRVRVPMKMAGFPADLFADRAGKTGLEDYLTRSFDRAVRSSAAAGNKEKLSNAFYIDAGRQEILERSALVVERDFVEARFSLQLPARGRTVLGKEAEHLICRFLPAIVQNSLHLGNIDNKKLYQHINTNRMQEYLREQLLPNKLVAFVADGSVLPRESGASDRPLPAGEAVPFISPAELTVFLEDYQGNAVKGMGIPEGVTLIVGGGYHGKSTLLQAVERGVYNHIPGDGREYTVTLAGAVKIRAEDGRSVTGVDISPFINNLPGGKSTTYFYSEDASGSTSQAANIMEAIEADAKLLLMDEDTSATNFMIRDARMQALVAREKEPITPFIDKVRSLCTEKKVSTLLVLGGSGDYFDIADRVIMLDEYVPRVVTVEARHIAERFVTGRKPEGGDFFGQVRKRIPDPASFDPQKGHKVKIGARGTRSIQFGRFEIDLTLTEQLVDPSQTRAIGDLIYFMVKNKLLNGKRSLNEAIQTAFKEVQEQGLDIISPFYGQHPGEYAMPRPLEVAATINRLRSLKLKDDFSR